MKLQTIVLDLTFCPTNPALPGEKLETGSQDKSSPADGEITDWIQRLQQEYTVKNMSAFRNGSSRPEQAENDVHRPEQESAAFHRDRLQSFFLGNGIRKEDALFLSDNRDALLAARNLDIAILACELSGKEAESFPMVAERVWETENEFVLKCYQREHKLPWEILQTERLILREECEDDLDSLYAMYEQPHVTEFLEPLYPDREKEREYMVKYRRYVYCYYCYGLWHVIDKQTGLPAGRAGLNPKTYSDGVFGAELGYMIVEPFLRKGYCIEACEGILQYAKETLELSEVYCLIRPDNKVSVHIAEKLGFKFDQQIEDEGRQMWRFFKKL